MYYYKLEDIVCPGCGRKLTTSEWEKHGHFNGLKNFNIKCPYCGHEYGVTRNKVFAYDIGAKHPKKQCIKINRSQEAKYRKDLTNKITEKLNKKIKDCNQCKHRIFFIDKKDNDEPTFKCELNKNIMWTANIKMPIPIECPLTEKDKTKAFTDTVKISEEDLFDILCNEEIGVSLDDLKNAASQTKK